MSNYSCTATINQPKPVVYNGLDVTNPMWPPFTVLQDNSHFLVCALLEEHCFNVQIDTYPEYDTKPNSHTVVVVMSRRSADDRVQFHNATFLSDCDVVYTGRLVFSDMSPLPNPSRGKRWFVAEGSTGEDRATHTIGKCDRGLMDEVCSLALDLN